MFLQQEPILKHNLPVEILGDPPPPKGDPVFELKPLPDTLKYAYLDEKKIYPVGDSPRVSPVIVSLRREVLLLFLMIKMN